MRLLFMRIDILRSFRPLILIYQHMDNKSPTKTTKHSPESPPRTIRKKSLPPYDRHILKIDRTRYELTSSSSQSEFPSVYQSSLEKTLLKKEGLNEFVRDLSKDRQMQNSKPNLQNRSSNPLRSYRVNGWRDNYYTNLLDWSHNNFVGVALRNDLCLYNMSVGDELETGLYRRYRFQKIEETINSLKFSPRNTKIALGSISGNLTCYDYLREKTAMSKKGHHNQRITAIEWDGNIIATGGKDCKLKVIDSKNGRQTMDFQQFHNQQICSLKSNGDNLLASGGNDNTVCIYDLRKPEKLLQFYEHDAAIKALDWTKSNVLLSGGGTTDRKIKFWKDGEGIISQIDSGSQICGIKASINSDEIVTCQGYSLNQIIIWNRKGRREFIIHGHSERVLYNALSPSGQHLATGAGDQQLKIWRLFPRKDQGKMELDGLR